MSRPEILETVRGLLSAYVSDGDIHTAEMAPLIEELLHLLACAVVATSLGDERAMRALEVWCIGDFIASVQDRAEDFGAKVLGADAGDGST